MARAMPRLKEATKHINWHPGHMHSGMLAMIGKLNTMDCVIEVHDARIPLIGRNKEFKEHLGLIKPRILVLNKSDLADLTQWDKVKAKLESAGDTEVILTNMTGDTFSYNERGYDTLLKRAITLIHKSERFNRDGLSDYKIMVVGIPNVGKSTLINRLRQYHLGLGGDTARTGSQAGLTKHVDNKIRICSRPVTYLVDTPGVLEPSATKDRNKAMKLALCSTISDKVINPFDLATYLLKFLNSTNNLSYVDMYQLKGPIDDIHLFCKEVVANARFENKDSHSNSFDGVCWGMIGSFRKGLFGQMMFLD